MSIFLSKLLFLLKGERYLKSQVVTLINKCTCSSHYIGIWHYRESNCNKFWAIQFDVYSWTVLRENEKSNTVLETWSYSVDLYIKIWSNVRWGHHLSRSLLLVTSNETRDANESTSHRVMQQFLESKMWLAQYSVPKRNTGYRANHIAAYKNSYSVWLRNTCIN